MNRIKNILHRLLPLLKIFAFSLLFVLMHILLITPLLVSGILTGDDFGREDDLFRLIMLGISLTATVLSILIANRLAKHWKPSLATLGFTQSIVRSTGIGLLVGGILITLCFVVIIGISSGQLVFSGLSTQAIISSLLLFVGVSVFEELLSRGYLLPYLQKHYGVVWAVMLSSLFFAAMHLANDHLSVIGLISIFLAGVLLAQLRLVYHNLWVPIGVHFIWNYLQGPVYGFSVSGNATESILIPIFEAPSLINGGEFGIEGSVVTLVVLSGAILALARLQYIRSTGLVTTRELSSDAVSQAA